MNKYPLHFLDFESIPSKIQPFNVIECQPVRVPFTIKIDNSIINQKEIESDSLENRKESIDDIKPSQTMPDLTHFQNLAWKLTMLKQQSQNNYFTGFVQGPSDFDREELLNSLRIPDPVLKRIGSVNKKLDKKGVISKSPGLYERKKSWGLNHSFDETEDKEKADKPICDLKHLPSPNSRKIINYDELKIYNVNDECLEEEIKSSEGTVKSFASPEYNI